MSNSSANPPVRNSNGRESKSSIAEHNRRRRAALIAEYKIIGARGFFQKYAVNAYYISMMKKSPHYIPRNADICRRLGLKYYKLIDPAPRGKPRNRRAVNLDDPVSGAATLRKHDSPAYLRRLVQELEG